MERNPKFVSRGVKMHWSLAWAFENCFNNTKSHVNFSNVFYWSHFIDLLGWGTMDWMAYCIGLALKAIFSEILFFFVYFRAKFQVRSVVVQIFGWVGAVLSLLYAETEPLGKPLKFSLKLTFSKFHTLFQC